MGRFHRKNFYYYQKRKNHSFFKILAILIVILALVVIVYSKRDIVEDKLNSVQFTKNILSKVKNIVNENIEKQIIVSDSHQECLDEINEEFTVLRKKAHSSSNIKILESKFFTNTNDALEYIERWRLTLSSITEEDLRENGWGDPIPYEDVTVVVFKVSNPEISLTSYLVCIDGKLTDWSIRKLMTP